MAESNIGDQNNQGEGGCQGEGIDDAKPAGKSLPGQNQQTVQANQEPDPVDKMGKTVAPVPEGNADEDEADGQRDKELSFAQLPLCRHLAPTLLFQLLFNFAENGRVSCSRLKSRGPFSFPPRQANPPLLKAEPTGQY